MTLSRELFADLKEVIAATVAQGGLGVLLRLAWCDGKPGQRQVKRTEVMEQIASWRHDDQWHTVEALLKDANEPTVLTTPEAKHNTRHR